MKAKSQKPVLSNSVLAALFSGLIATCITEVYNIAYRSITGYNPSFIINVSSIIFGILIPSMFAGVIFFFFINYIKGGVYLFKILFVIVFAALANFALHSHYGGNLPVFKGFAGLLFGCEVILGISIIVFIPYFFKHDKLYLD